MAFNGSALPFSGPICPSLNCVAFPAIFAGFFHVGIFKSKLMAILAMRGFCASFGKVFYNRLFGGFGIAREFFRVENFFYRKPPRKPNGNSPCFNPKLARPLRDRLCFALIRQKPIVSLIVGLFYISSPSAILRGIRTVIVDPINRLAFWPIPHVGVKIFKALPSFANCDAPAAVAVVRPRGFAQTPFAHTFPYLVGFGSMHPVFHKGIIGKLAVIIKNKIGGSFAI